jgi:hypothetical protein
MELPQSFVDEGVRGMFDAARQRQAQRAMLTQQKLMQQQTAFDEQRAVRQAEIDQSIAELSDDEKRFPAVMHDIARERAQIDLDYKRRSAALKTFGANPSDAERFLKTEEESLASLKEAAIPWEKTEQHKKAAENFGKLTDSNKRLNTLVSTIETTKNMLESGDEQGALENLRTNVIKPLNSIDSDDAVQIGEVLLKFRKLMNAPETAQFAGKSVFNPSAYINKYIEARNKQEKEGARSDMVAAIKSLFDADPKGFLKTAIDGANSHVESYNKRLKEQVIDTTSPGVARQMGAVPMEYVSPIKEAPSDIAVVRPGQPAQPANMPSISPEAARAELERRKAARATQQKDFTGKQGF